MNKPFTLKVILILLLVNLSIGLQAQNVSSAKDSIGSAKKAASHKTKAVRPFKTTKKDTSFITKLFLPHKNKPVWDTIRVRSVYGEIGGPGLAISANYDSRFAKERDQWGYRIGIGYYNTGDNHVFTIPFQINYLLQFKKHPDFFWEFGGGTTFLHSNGDNKGTDFEFDKITGFVGTATIGARYQPRKTHLNVRLGFVPIFYDEGVVPAGGISVGYTFKK